MFSAVAQCTRRLPRHDLGSTVAAHSDWRQPHHQRHGQRRHFRDHRYADMALGVRSVTTDSGRLGTATTPWPVSLALQMSTTRLIRRAALVQDSGTDFDAGDQTQQHHGRRLAIQRGTVPSALHSCGLQIRAYGAHASLPDYAAAMPQRIPALAFSRQKKLMSFLAHASAPGLEHISARKDHSYQRFRGDCLGVTAS